MCVFKHSLFHSLPKLVKSLENVDVVDVSCGGGHTCALSKDGKSEGSPSSDCRLTNSKRGIMVLGTGSKWSGKPINRMDNYDRAFYYLNHGLLAGFCRFNRINCWFS